MTMGTEIWCLLTVIALLLGLVAWQQLFFTKQIQVLVDKLMSRSFREYSTVANPPPPKPAVPPEPPEDLRVLQGIAPF